MPIFTSRCCGCSLLNSFAIAGMAMRRFFPQSALHQSNLVRARRSTLTSWTNSRKQWPCSSTLETNCDQSRLHSCIRTFAEKSRTWSTKPSSFVRPNAVKPPSGSWSKCAPGRRITLDPPRETYRVVWILVSTAKMVILAILTRMAPNRWSCPRKRPRKCLLKRPRYCFKTQLRPALTCVRNFRLVRPGVTSK